MKREKTEMPPVFGGPIHAALWIVALAAVLLSPIWTRDIVSEETRFDVMAKRLGSAGWSDWLKNETLISKEPLDIVFMGNSRMATGFDHQELAAEAKRLGVDDLKSVTLASNWPNYDLLFALLQNTLKNRKPKLVVILPPPPAQTFSHPAAKYLRRFEFGAPWMQVESPHLLLSSWGEISMISLRLIVARLVPPGRSMPVPAEYDLSRSGGTLLVRRGYKGNSGEASEAFVATRPATPAPGAQMAVLGRDAAPSFVSFSDEAPTSIEETYIDAIQKLCSENGATLVFVRFSKVHEAPATVEVGRHTITWGVPFIMASKQMIFGEKEAAQSRRYYYDDSHLNANGARQNSVAFAPALVSLLVKLRERQ